MQPSCATGFVWKLCIKGRGKNFKNYDFSYLVLGLVFDKYGGQGLTLTAW